jgi:hypothetical protein
MMSPKTCFTIIEITVRCKWCIHKTECETLITKFSRTTKNTIIWPICGLRMIILQGKIIYFQAGKRLYTKNQGLVRMNHIIDLINAHNNHTYSSEYGYSTISFRSFSWIWLTPSLPNSTDTKLRQKFNLEQDIRFSATTKTYMFKMDTILRPLVRKLIFSFLVVFAM